MTEIGTWPQCLTANKCINDHDGSAHEDGSATMRTAVPVMAIQVQAWPYRSNIGHTGTSMAIRGQAWPYMIKPYRP